MEFLIYIEYFEKHRSEMKLLGNHFQHNSDYVGIGLRIGDKFDVVNKAFWQNTSFYSISISFTIDMTLFFLLPFFIYLSSIAIFEFKNRYKCKRLSYLFSKRLF